MRQQAENLFTYYRGPSARSSAKDPGAQLEDNTTASFLKLLSEMNKNSPKATREIISELIGSETLPPSISIKCKDQVGEWDINGESQLVGISAGGVSAPEHIKPASKEQPGIVDGIIQINNDLTVFIEVKTKGDELSDEQLERYAKNIGIDNSIEQYNTVTWNEIYNKLQEIKDLKNIDSVSMFLLSEFAEYLRLTTLKKVLAASDWQEGTEQYLKTISIRYERPMNRNTFYVERNPPEYHLEFKAQGYNTVAFSPNEWAEAINQLPESVVEAFLNNDFAGIAEHSGETLATVGKSDGVRKLIESKPKNGTDRLVFQSRTSKHNSWYQRRPIFNENDFDKLYTTRDTVQPAFSQTALEHLFREGDLEKVHNKF